jgi:hypothetical protein
VQRRNQENDKAPNTVNDDAARAPDEVDGNGPKSGREAPLRITVRKLELPVRPRGVLAE